MNQVESPSGGTPSDWEPLARIALSEARAAGADFADVRLMRLHQQSILARNDRIDRVLDSHRVGFGVRVLARGAWGFAGSSLLTEDSLRATARRAAAIARGSSVLVREPVILAPEPPHQASHVTPRARDPFDVPLSVKSALLLQANEEMRAVPEIRLAVGLIQQTSQKQFYASTEGSGIHRDRIITAATIMAHAAGNDDRQSRAYHISGRHAGWEQIEAGDLVGNAPRVAREAKEKLFAERAPEGRYDLILDPEHLHLTIHESIGHATELDRVLGYEADYAGTSFATVDKLGSFQYGSKTVNVVADNITPEFLASTGFDDEGVAGQRWDIIREGILVDYGTGREVAPKIGAERSHGTCRADGWWSTPIVRIPNLGLLPGKGTPEELIADTRDGIFIQGAGTFSIDQQRLNFQFGGDMFWRVRNGRISGPLKNVVYQSSTPVFWNACDAVCGPEDWRAVGILNCGKGQPGQAGTMSHYSSTSRFRGIPVGRGEE